MEFSLPAWLGALVGMIIAAALYGLGIRLVERRLRGSSNAKTGMERTPMEREALENKLSVVRRLILACDVAILAAAGYWISGKIFGAPGG